MRAIQKQKKTKVTIKCCKEFFCSWVDPITQKACCKSFLQKGNLNQHLRSHKGEVIHACGHGSCTKMFTSTSNRDDHVRRHLNDRPYKCHHAPCEKAYFRNYQLENHLAKKHSKIEHSADIVDNENHSVDLVDLE